jgi:hypothetical protein
MVENHNNKIIIFIGSLSFHVEGAPFEAYHK